MVRDICASASFCCRRFHGEAIERYVAAIRDIADREIDGWPLDTPVPLAPLMQAIMLDVIASGILGIDGQPRPGTPEHGLGADDQARHCSLHHPDRQAD